MTEHNRSDYFFVKIDFEEPNFLVPALMNLQMHPHQLNTMKAKVQPPPLGCLWPDTATDSTGGCR